VKEESDDDHRTGRTLSRTRAGRGRRGHARTGAHGPDPADLLAAPAARPAAPTFAEYIPVVSALVSDGCRRAYGSYWNRVTGQWGSRRIDEPAA
jgi:hypothetical protein